MRHRAASPLQDRVIDGPVREPPSTSPSDGPLYVTAIPNWLILVFALASAALALYLLLGLTTL